MYTNSLLATLNARKKIRTAGTAIHTPGDVSFFMKDFGKTSIGARVRWKTPFIHIIEKTKKIFITQRQTNTSVKIDTTQEFSRDENRDYPDLEDTEVGLESRFADLMRFDSRLSTESELFDPGLCE